MLNKISCLLRSSFFVYDVDKETFDEEFGIADALF